MTGFRVSGTLVGLLLTSPTTFGQLGSDQLSQPGMAGPRSPYSQTLKTVPTFKPPDIRPQITAARPQVCVSPASYSDLALTAPYDLLERATQTKLAGKVGLGSASKLVSRFGLAATVVDLAINPLDIRDLDGRVRNAELHKRVLAYQKCLEYNRSLKGGTGQDSLASFHQPQSLHGSPSPSGDSSQRTAAQSGSTGSQHNSGSHPARSEASPAGNDRDTFSGNKKEEGAKNKPSETRQPGTEAGGGKVDIEMRLEHPRSPEKKKE